MDYFVVFIWVMITLFIFGPVWFLPLRYAFRNKYKNGRNFKISVEQIPSSHGMFGVEWKVIGPERWDSSPERKTGYEFSSKSVDEAFEKAGAEVEKAIKEMKPNKTFTFPSYSYEINEHGERVNMKEN